MDTVQRSVLKKITPSPKEEKEISETIEMVKSAVSKNIGSLSYTVAGSFTRGTWMLDKREFDIFILFPEHISREELEKRGLELGKKIVSAFHGSFTIAYAEHPYVRASYKKFSVDIVPCYQVSDPAKIKSAVDRTPFHNQYLAANFPPSLAKEVRLLKQFLKANGLYGSDTKVQGFSGYLCELLILHYKSFKTLIYEASRWQPGEYMDIEGHHPIKPTFPDHPLVVIDPVDPKRNVAAVLSHENFIIFTSLARAFLSRPSESYFFRKQKKPNIAALKKRMLDRKSLFLAVEMQRPDVIDDILYPQLRRSLRRLRDILHENEFQTVGEQVFANGKKCILLFEFEVWSLPHIKKLHGPPIFVRKHAREFLQKYKKARLWVEEKSWVAEIKRPFPTAEILLRSFLKQPPAILQEKGIASHVSISLKKSHRLLTAAQLQRQAKIREYYDFLSEYMEKEVECPLSRE